MRRTLALALLVPAVPTQVAAQVPETHPFRVRFEAVPRMEAAVDAVRPEAGVSLERISAVAAGQDGTLYVLHRPASGDPLVVLDRNGRLLRSWGAGLFTTPHGIRVAPDGNVWTVDASSSKVLQFTPEGDLLLEVQLDRPDGDRPFCGATDVAFGPGGRVFVADGYCNARIVEIDARGEMVREWGAPGAGPGELDIPHAIVYGPDGLLYVADRENGRVQRFTTAGGSVDSWEYAGLLLGIAFAPSGRLFLSLTLGGGPADAHVVEMDPETGEMLARLEVVAHELSVTPDGIVLPAAYGQEVLLLRLAND